ncbi:ABC transporter G family member 6 [Cajanus cajan]|uniref:ABC transporter G family member 1 n=1 Tax=Cajanus cajan TaxID=3821 RepID=A0A151RWY4_CAJCA|nr:ABC transporter G family member 6 [Cajanus cajan]KYP47060.1 ABC transporter G family member 1 [Cajanus cajan]
MSSRIATENAQPLTNATPPPYFDLMELDHLSRSSVSAEMPTLGQLLKHVGDARKEATGDGSQTPLHHALDITDDARINPSSLPFVLSFSNLTYSVKVRRKISLSTIFQRRRGGAATATVAGTPGVEESTFTRTKTLLNDISGEARDGEIMAVLGASGSGKSTLIDALANRIAKGSLKGKVALNGEALESRLLKVISAYVMQDDLLFPMLTVEETLMFAAEFRLPRTLSKSKKKARVQALIDQLGLRNAAKTVIGDEGHRGVSGGERRRVSIGTDIIHDPILLFLDEPTSGLDSTSAYMVVKVLQRIAQSGSIVIMSIHQPSYRILGLLDRMIFLSRGQTVYSGSPTQLPVFFAEFGHPIPESDNRTEFALDIIRELEGSPGGTKSLVEFNKSWQSMTKHNQETTTDAERNGGLSLKEAISASISRGKLVSGATNTGPNASSMVPTFANPFWVEMATLSKRSLMNSRRMPELFGTRLGTVMVTGFILATMFWRLDNSPKGVQERLGFYAFAMSTTFYTTADALPVFLQERYIFMRETAYNAYRRLSYLVSHALVALPSLAFLSLAFAATTFWAVGLDGSFFFYFLIIFASFWAGNSFVTFLSGVVPHVMLGYTIVVAILAYFLLFSGFFVNRDRIPNYWIWFHYLSLVKYPYEAVLQNEFDETTKCFVRGVQIFDSTPLASVPEALKVKLLESMSNTLGTNITTSTCLTTGVDVLHQNAVTDLTKWNCFWITVAWGFFFRFLFYLSLLLGSKNKRR